MIYGIGTDIVDTRRVHAVYLRHPQRFVQKLLSENERQLFSQTSNPLRFLAKRWVAKEAFAKACGTGLRSPILFPAISLLSDDLGKPLIKTTGELSSWMEKRHITNVQLSFSDEPPFALSFVILEKQ